jgi:hypothetical protein
MVQDGRLLFTMFSNSRLIRAHVPTSIGHSIPWRRQTDLGEEAAACMAGACAALDASAGGARLCPMDPALLRGGGSRPCPRGGGRPDDGLPRVRPQRLGITFCTSKTWAPLLRYHAVSKCRYGGAP